MGNLGMQVSVCLPVHLCTNIHPSSHPSPLYPSPTPLKKKKKKKKNEVYKL